MDYELGYDLDEALKREGLSKSDLDAIRYPLISGVPDTITDKQLALFLSACGTVVEARKVIKIYYEMRKNTPDIFLVRDPEMDSIQQCFQAQHYIQLPVTPDNNLLIFHQLSDPRAASYNIEHAVKTFFMAVDLCLYKLGPRNGIIFIVDAKNIGIAHIARFRISIVKQLINYLQEALPAKLKAIHIINSFPLIDKILTIMKPFMKAELLKLLNFHSSSMDYEKFYDEVIPRSCLPSNYGGTLKSVSELQEESINEFIKHKRYFMAESAQRSTLESQNIHEIQNKFTKLDID